MQKQEISLYNFGGYEIRTLSDEHGNPLFIAADVAKALDYRDAANMTRILDGCEIGGTRLVSTSSSNQYGEGTQCAVGPEYCTTYECVE